MVDNAYTRKKKRKGSYIMPDVKGSIDSFNHALEGTGDIPGTGMAISEDMEDDIKVADDIFIALQNEFPTTTFPQSGVSYIFPSGKFFNIEKYRDEVDRFICSRFEEFDPDDYPNGYLLDSEQCVEVSDGRGKANLSNRGITLPKVITNAQIDSIEDWLQEFPYEEIDVKDTFGHLVTFDLEEGGIQEVLNSIKKYKTSQILSEELNEGEILIDSDLPDVTEDIIKDEDAGIGSLFIDMINDCWSAIDNYHSMIVTLDSLNRHEFDETLKELLENRNKEVGALQGLLESISGAAAHIEQGRDEAQDQISFDSVEESFSLKEAYDSFTEDELNARLQKFVDNPTKFIVDIVNNRKEFGPYYTKIASRKHQGKKTNVKAITNIDKFINYCIIASMLSYDELKQQLLLHPSSPRNPLVQRLMDFVNTFRNDRDMGYLFEGKIKTYEELSKPVKMLLKEGWASNGSLQDFDAASLVEKAFTNKYATNSVRDFEDVLLYINVDPGFVFGQRAGSDKIWVDVVEIDKATNAQRRIYMDSADSKDAAAELLQTFINDYMNDNVDMTSNEGENIDGKEEPEEF